MGPRWGIVPVYLPFSWAFPGLPGLGFVVVRGLTGFPGRVDSVEDDVRAAETKIRLVA